MYSYEERIYLNGLKAQVKGYTTVASGNVYIKFYFSWADEQWQLTEVL